MEIPNKNPEVVRSSRARLKFLIVDQMNDHVMYHGSQFDFFTKCVLLECNLQRLPTWLFLRQESNTPTSLCLIAKMAGMMTLGDIGRRVSKLGLPVRPPNTYIAQMFPIKTLPIPPIRLPSHHLSRFLSLPRSLKTSPSSWR